MQRFRSCLSPVIGSIVFLLLVVFSSRAYGHWRLEQVNRDLFTLADKLGYTPDALLQNDVHGRDYNLLFPWDKYCDATLYYTTTMSAEEFSERLRQAVPELWDTGSTQTSSFVLFGVPDLAVDGVALHGADAFRVSQQAPVTLYKWILPGDKYRGRIGLYQTKGVHKRLEYKDHLITGNIVEIRQSAGIYQAWMDCATNTSNSTQPVSQ